ncbi:MAG: hypothetical protein ACI9GW_000553 [Halieaceae bacterium]|jgi:hypothetical protein
MVKKFVLGIVVLLVIFAAGLGIYAVGSPEVVIVNRSSQNVNEVIVKLPSNRIVFGAIAPRSESTIFYSWSQSEGVYDYLVSFAHGLNRTGKCGYVTRHEIGKRLSLIVHVDLTITCEESSKV